MYIKEGLIFDKHSDRLTGFADLGDINNHLMAFERIIEDGTSKTEQLARTVIVFMFKGLFTPVMACTFDGASSIVRWHHYMNDGKCISSKHLVDLYKRDKGKGSGLALVPKLTFEHIELTPFSKMHVDLAPQVLSESVGKALQLTGGPEAEERAKFVMLFDKFFDIINFASFTQGTKARKPFCYPYRHKDDHRLKWLKTEFLPYLKIWENSVYP
uniref:Transposable element P transposase-like GTP-binding insertion domain-containing protein n=1 Tax=Amphimedon queenslandica TaxID=400682 RepID=A0A1X7U701_AMPQE